MNTKSKGFVLLDIAYLALTIVPILVGIVLKILTTPLAEGIAISGALIYFEIPMPVQNLVITESQINSWLVILSVLGFCLYITHGLSERMPTKRQHFSSIFRMLQLVLTIGLREPKKRHGPTRRIRN